MSEEEAKTKWCPFAQLAYQIYSNTGVSEFMGCSASNCMMWRWEDWANGIPYDQQIRKGHCGLAGKDDFWCAERHDQPEATSEVMTMDEEKKETGTEAAITDQCSRLAASTSYVSGRKHLWEVDHPYYCNRGNYFAPRREKVDDRYKSWGDFLANYHDADFDMNLLFRWDWYEGSDDDEEEYPKAFNGDINYRNGELFIFWMGQRKGLYRWTTIEVCRADEPAVIEFLKPRLAHLLKLWEPLT